MKKKKKIQKELDDKKTKIKELSDALFLQVERRRKINSLLE
jgi:hypothetical protein